jgi:Domain of unknown function (DUF4062)
MVADSRQAPRSVPQVMVSSTFLDLKEHRAAAIAALNRHGFHPNVMEHSSAKLIDVLESSLKMVSDSAAYILIIGKKYGQIPECPRRNPNGVSLTELEFEEAVRLGRPTLLFVMGEDHDVKVRDVEPDADKKRKLEDFRERAKRASPESPVQRVYEVFNSLEEFKEKIGPPLAELREHLALVAVEDLDQTVPTRVDGCSLGSQRLLPEDFSMSVVRKGRDSWTFSWKVRLRNLSILVFDIRYLNLTGHLVESRQEVFTWPTLIEMPEFHYGQHVIGSESARQVRCAELSVFA